MCDIKIKEVNILENLNYDLNAICETADSIYWTLVPNELFKIWNINSYYANVVDDSSVYTFNKMEY